MARWNDLEWTPKVLEAAELWRDKCFYGDGALFSDDPNEKLWTLDNIQQLEKLTIANADLSERTFEEKLKIQLLADTASNNKPDNVIQLAAELTWLIYLISTGIKPDTKIAKIKNIFDWSSRIINDKHQCLDEAVLKGIANPGQRFSENIFKYWIYLVTMLIEWKSRTPDQRKNYLHSYSAWGFARWWDETWTKKYSELRNVPNPPSVQLRPQIRHALLFFLYPDYFERVVSWEDKKKICLEFIHKIDKETAEEFMQKGDFDSQIDTDQTIFAIRKKLIKDYDKKIDFYLDPIEPLWRKSNGIKPTRKALRSAIDEITNSISQSPTSSADEIFDALVDKDDLITKAKEGNPKLVTHYVKERCASLRNAKIQQLRSESKAGNLSCEACGTDAKQNPKYPEEYCERIFEVHHKIPLADIDIETEMSVDDLALLCANCHRAIHATNPLLSVEEFKNSIT